MPLRPSQAFNLIVASVALALLAEGALLWKLSDRAPQPGAANSPSMAAPLPTMTVPTAPAPLFVAPGVAPPSPTSSLGQKSAASDPVPAKNGAISAADRARAKTYFEAASAALKLKDSQSALENFRRVAQIAPDNLPTRLNLALLYLSANRPAEAIPHLKKAAKLDPKGAAARFQLAQAYLALGKPALAVAPLREVVRLAPGERAARALLAQVYASQKRPRDAYAQWSALAQSDPRDVQAHLQAASLAADALQLPREAEKWLRRAQTFNPKDPRAALLLGRLFLGQKQPQRAITALEAAIKARPDVFEIYPALADARLAAGDLGGARAALQSALGRLPVAKTAAQKQQLAGAEGNLRLSLGRVLGQSKQPKLARREFERAAALLPRQAEPRALLALAALQSGDNNAARAALQKTLELDPTRARDRLTLAQLLAQNRDFSAAQTQFALYARQQPRDAGALTQWAQVTVAAKQPDKALPILAKIAALQPQNPAPWMQSGAILRDAKRLAPALSSFERALALRPTDASALFEVARLQSALKRPGASQSWQKLIARQPDFAPAYAALLGASERDGNGAGARIFLARQLGRGADNPGALAEILRFYQAKGRASEAKALLSDITARNPRAKSARDALESLGAKSFKKPLTSTPAPTATKSSPVP